MSKPLPPAHLFPDPFGSRLIPIHLQAATKHLAYYRKLGGVHISVSPLVWYPLFTASSGGRAWEDWHSALFGLKSSSCPPETFMVLSDANYDPSKRPVRQSISPYISKSIFSSRRTITRESVDHDSPRDMYLRQGTKSVSEASRRYSR
jgi:hypothetical protein